jgi:hypothetical protein
MVHLKVKSSKKIGSFLPVQEDSGSEDNPRMDSMVMTKKIQYLIDGAI